MRFIGIPLPPMHPSLDTLVIACIVAALISFILMIYFIVKFKFKSAILWLCLLLTSLGINAYVSHLKNPKNNYIDPITTNTMKTKKPLDFSSVLSSRDNGEIAKALVMLTNKSDPGPTRNYFWNSGTSQIGDKAKNLDIGTVKFSHDTQGRPSLAVGKLTYDMWDESRGSRQGTPLNPPFWPKWNPKVAITYALNDKTYHGYMYNRSHSIADSLAGTASYTSADNFTIGTRPQNVGADQNGGMRMPESMAEKYWQQGKHGRNAYILYQVLPIYEKSERIPRGTIVDEKSSDGKLNYRFVIINDAEGYTINYFTGNVKKSTQK